MCILEDITAPFATRHLIDPHRFASIPTLTQEKNPLYVKRRGVDVSSVYRAICEDTSEYID
jgi:hypothetical protein